MDDNGRYTVFMVEVGTDKFRPLIKEVNNYSHGFSTARVKTKMQGMNTAVPIYTQQFKTKEEFMGHVIKVASEAWDGRENEESFENIKKDIVDDFDRYKSEPMEVIKDKDELIDKAKDILKKYEDSNWMTYAILKGVCGVDLIDGPDIDNPEELPQKRKIDPKNNNGVFRRVDRKNAKQV